MFKKATAVFLFFITAMLVPSGALAQPKLIEKVTVSISSDVSIPLPVKLRMEKSVYSVAEQLLTDKKQEDIRKNSDTYEKIIHDVFDKLLVGYTIQKVNLSCSEEAKIDIKLIPWQEVIRRIDVDVTVDGMPPLIKGMVLKDGAGIKNIFQETLAGLPTGAIDWSNGVLKKNVNSFMQENLPEFRADFDVEEISETARIKVTFYPLLPVVRTLDLQMRSETFPNFWLLSMREQMQAEANDLIGVPVAFVKRHQSDISRHYSNILDNTYSFKNFHVTTATNLNAAENMTLSSHSNLEKLRIRGESWSDIGHNSNGNQRKHRLRSYLGWRPDARNDFYVFAEIFPGNNEWGSGAGYMHNAYKDLWLGLQYDLKHQKISTELRYDISRWWTVHHEYRTFDQKSEWGLGYRLHDFMNLKLMYDGNEAWLRVIGNL